MSGRVLLTVCMIVKNEVHTLAKTLESVKGVADRVCLLDTGSTDGTQDLARRVVGDDKLDLFEEPFVDFSTSRNRCLDLAGDSSEFLLSLDADDVLVGGQRLREFLTSVKNLKGEGYELKIAVTGALFTTVRLFRSRARWRYVGAVHELLLPQERAPTQLTSGSSTGCASTTIRTRWATRRPRAGGRGTSSSCVLSSIQTQTTHALVSTSHEPQGPR